MRVADQHSVECKISPQARVTVRLSPEFANGLCTSLQSAPTPEPRPPAETGGLLFGTAEEDLITIRAFRSFAFWDPDEDKSPGDEHVNKPARRVSGVLSTDAELSGLELIGWSYVRHGSGGLLQRDVQFHNRHFPHARDLMLTLDAEREQGPLLELFARTSDAPLSTQHFRCGSFRLCAESPVTRPIDVNLEVKRRPDDLAAFQSAAQVTSRLPPNTTTLLSGAASPEKNGLLWLISVVLLVLVTGMTFAWAHTRGQYLALTRHSQSAIGRTAPISGLRMQAEGGADGVLLSWNHNALAVRSAKQGILHIDDGSAQHTIYLDPSDLANGSIVYRPASRDASFRLELLGDYGSVLSSDVQTFRASKSTAGTDSPETTTVVAGVEPPKLANRENHESAPTQKATVSLGPETTPNYVPARALKQILPDTKLFAVPDIREGAEVDVQVRIDEKGGVVDAHVKNGTRDNSLLRSAALEAAKQWIFEPAKIDGKKIPSDHTIAFQFHP